MSQNITDNLLLDAIQYAKDGMRREDSVGDEHLYGWFAKF